MPVFISQGVVFAVVDKLNSICSNITIDRAGAWDSLLKHRGYAELQDEAIEAYEAIGYVLKEYHLSEYSLLESILGNVTGHTLDLMKKDLKRSAEFFPEQCKDALEYVIEFQKANFGE